MPATRSRSRSPRRTSTSPYSKDKTGKPNARELITIKTEEKLDSEKTTASMESSKSNTASSKDSKTPDKPPRKPSESPASKSNSSGSWNSNKSKELKSKERKFSGRCRLFVGNLLNCEETELREMFEKYGEVAEVFVNKDKGFGFVRMVSILAILLNIQYRRHLEYHILEMQSKKNASAGLFQTSDVWKTVMHAC